MRIALYILSKLIYVITKFKSNNQSGILKLKL